NPAKVFMGDTGSLALGLLIVIFGIRLSNYSGESLLPFEIIFFPLLALPVIDTLRVMSWRMKLKKNPFKADRTHFHHLLQFLKLKPRSIALTYILLTSVVVFTAIVVYEIQSNVLSSLLIAMFTACVVFAVVLYLDKQKQIRMMRKNKDKMYAMMSKNQLLIKSLIR
ncbi:MAG: UDP-GlcNAc:undecaprenyl-phosphate GlcNAc-1-phosphate transferase, partial [Arenicella sp.]